MNKALLQSIIKNKKTVYFVSPHFDDAILSAGATLQYLAKHVPVVIINVFTQAGERPYTLSVKANLKQSGFADAKELYREREKEDKMVLGKVTKNITNLGFIDSLWRKKKPSHPLENLLPEINYIYPTYRFHVAKGKIAKHDLLLIEEIKKKLRKIIKGENAVVFCPMAIGDHVDHVIVRKVCDELFANPIHWSDFPYNEKSTKDTDDYEMIVFAKDLKKKQKLIEGYKTQFSAMFQDGLTLRAEKFYYKK